MAWKDKFKRFFSAKNENRKRFARRADKISDELAGCWQLLGLFMDEGWHSAEYERRVDAIATGMGDLQDLLETKPGKAYEKLGPLKDQARGVLNDMHEVVKAYEEEKADDGSTKTVRMIEVEYMHTVADQLGTRANRFPLDGPSLLLEISIEVPGKLYITLSKDPLLHQKLQDAASETLKSYAKDTADLIAEYETIAIAEGEASEEAFDALAEVGKHLSVVEKNLAGQVRLAVKAAIKEFKQTKQEYQDYQIGMGVKLTVALCGVTGGVAGLAASPFTFGFSGIIAIWGLFKAVVKLAKIIADLASSADAVCANARVLVEGIKAALESAEGKLRGTAIEVGSQVVEFLTGSNFFMGLGGAKAEVVLAKNKYHGVDLNSHSLAVTLQDLLLKMDDFSTLTAANAGTDRQLKKAAKELAKLPAKIGKQLDKIVDAQERVTTNRGWCVDAIKELDKLEAEKINTTVTGITKAVATVADLSLGAAGGIAGADFSKAGEELNVAMGIFNSVIGTVDEELAGQLTGGA